MKEEKKKEESAFSKNVGAWAQPEGMKAVEAGVGQPENCRPTVRVATWNVAGVSGNVFEFWGSAPNEIMEGVEKFMLEDSGTLLSAVQGGGLPRLVFSQSACGILWSGCQESWEVLTADRAAELATWLKKVGRETGVSHVTSLALA